jgi:uncharacterized protein (TIGR03382 family)
MRFALAAFVVAVAALPSVAEASCSDPTFCICGAASATVFEAHRIADPPDGGPDAGDGMAIYAVDSVVGAPIDGGAPAELARFGGLSDRILTNPQGGVVELNASGSPFCKPGLSLTQTEHALLDGEQCVDDAFPGVDRECHDAGDSFLPGCSTAPGPSLLALALGLLALRRRHLGR